LQVIVEHFLNRIIQHVEEVPYGIRWICKQLAEACRENFKDADRYQIGSLVGGYIYLRFFNPVICHPVNLLKGRKVSPRMHRNLVLIAKVLQNQSNGVYFRDKSLVVLNNFLDQNKEKLLGYFQKLIETDSLEDWVNIDKLVVRRQSTLKLKFNQIFLIHRLLYENSEWWNSSEDPIWHFLKKLGTPPNPIERSNNSDVLLNVQPPECAIVTEHSTMDNELDSIGPKEAREIDGKIPI